MQSCCRAVISLQVVGGGRGRDGCPSEVDGRDDCPTELEGGGRDNSPTERDGRHSSASDGWRDSALVRYTLC